MDFMFMIYLISDAVVLLSVILPLVVIGLFVECGRTACRRLTAFLTA